MLNAPSDSLASPSAVGNKHRGKSSLLQVIIYGQTSFSYAEVNACLFNDRFLILMSKMYEKKSKFTIFQTVNQQKKYICNNSDNQIILSVV